MRRADQSSKSALNRPLNLPQVRSKGSPSSALPSLAVWAAVSLLASAQGAMAQGAMAQATRVVAWGTRLDPHAQSLESRTLAKTLAQPASPQWRAKGDQKRSYRFAEANADLPYRVCVPAAWNGKDALPLVMFLHGAGNTESSYLDQNNKLMVKLADEHGAILVSPLGHQSAYGAFIRLPAVFDEQGEADKLLAQITDQTERANELSEKDVINVLELVLNEYPVDSARIFLTGHSMGSGGTWYLGGKYSYYWRGLAPMSGPFVLKKGYPWEAVLKIPVFVTEGTNTSSTESSRRLRDWMKEQKGRIAFKEVAADHAGMVPLVLPAVFAFFDSVSALPVSLDAKGRSKPAPIPRETRFTYDGNPLFRGPVRSGDGPGHFNHYDLYDHHEYFDLRGRAAAKVPAPAETAPKAREASE